MAESNHSALSGTTNHSQKVDRQAAQKDAMRRDTVSTVHETRRV
jgi:hypothetical protein